MSKTDPQRLPDWHFYREGVLGKFSEDEFKNAHYNWRYNSSELGSAAFIIDQLWEEIEKLRKDSIMTEPQTMTDDEKTILDFLANNGWGKINYMETCEVYADKDRALESFNRLIAQRKSAWQTIESYPMDGTAVLLYNPEGYKKKIARGYFSKHRNSWIFDSSDMAGKFTHWMPLPEEPK